MISLIFLSYFAYYYLWYVDGKKDEKFLVKELEEFAVEIDFESNQSRSQAT